MVNICTLYICLSTITIICLDDWLQLLSMSVCLSVGLTAGKYVNELLDYHIYCVT